MAKSWEHILGGYATDTLTEDEKRRLFEAALEDQELFDTLADEEALKALLANPESRRRILSSLEQQSHTQGSPLETPDPPRLSWFKQKPTLAWAGSVAALGLMLIFGWQMEREWGPVVQEQEEQARSDSQKTDEQGIRSPSLAMSKKGEQVKNIEPQVKELRDSRQPVSPAPAAPKSTFSPKSPVEAQPVEEGLLTAPPKRRIRQSAKPSAELPSERFQQARSDPGVRDEMIEEDREIALSSLPEPKAGPSLKSPVTKVKPADQAAKSQIASSPSAAEGQESSQDQILEDVARPASPEMSDLPDEGMSSISKPELPQEGERLKKSAGIEGAFTSTQTKGLRYRFVAGSVETKGEPVLLEEFSGDWKHLKLVIESNVPGHLYVLSSYSPGKWQWVKPAFLIKPGVPGGGITMEAHRPMEFSLAQVTNRMGVPVVDSIRVLFTSTPLESLSVWLQSKEFKKDLSSQSRAQIEYDHYLLQKVGESEAPLRFAIMLK